MYLIYAKLYSWEVRKAYGRLSVQTTAQTYMCSITYIIQRGYNKIKNKKYAMLSFLIQPNAVRVFPFYIRNIIENYL